MTGRSNGVKILIACGGTGGHIFPGLSLYRALKKRQTGTDIVLVLDERAISSSIVTGEYFSIYLSLAPLRIKFDLQNIFFVLKSFKGIFQSLKVILRLRPHIVVGFGGYASFFLVFFAWIFRIKTVIHEQNVTPGRANRVLASLVDKIAIGFARTGDYFGVNSHKVKFTGSPLRPNLVRIEETRAYEFLGLYPDKFTILIMGGSQGSHKINTVGLAAVSKILDKSRFQIIHLCGRGDSSFLENGYKDLGIKVRIFAFLHPMEYAYSAADIVISRAGSATINEIAFFSLPSILVPYPYVRRHQIENAHYLCQNNAAFLIEEKDLNAEILKDKILELFNNSGLRKLMSSNISMFSNFRADELLADLVLND